jgi:hypothetical protein
MLALLCGALPLAIAPTVRADVSLNFDLPDNTQATDQANSTGGSFEQILDYYDGGADENGAIGPSDGIVFGSDALSVLNYPLNNIANEPDGGGASMFFLAGPGDIMDVAAGFTNGFSFYETAEYVGTAKIYSGLDATGVLLASVSLPVSYDDALPNFDVWTPVGVHFSGTAESVDFSGTADYIAFADVTLGSDVPQIGNSVRDEGGLSIEVLAAVALTGAVWTTRRRLTVANALGSAWTVTGS